MKSESETTELVSGVFPGNLGVVLAPELGTQTFRVEMPEGENYLAWVCSANFCGIETEDFKQPLSDFEDSKSVQHAGILKPIHMARKGDIFVIVTEDFRGESLLSILHRKRQQSEDRTRQVFDHLCSIFEVAHNSRVLHRALSPANVLVDKDWNIRVFGFGLANIFYDQWIGVLNGAGRKDSDYVAPEILSQGLHKAVPHCDIFAIGRIIFELYVGQLSQTDHFDAAVSIL